MHIPTEYHGREQSWLKHRFLTEYLRSWAHKLGSTARRLWYVDVFAGPWRSSDTDLHDTSIHIGLNALEEAAQTWEAIGGKEIELGAIFVEKDPAAFRLLEAYLAQCTGRVRAQAFLGEFGAHVDEIEALIGKDAAFIFVDPTGFKGVEMGFIAPLVASRYRDVLINVMFNDVNRFKDDGRTFLREQMRAFFGLREDDLPPGLPEPELLRFYRRQLKARSGLDYVADIAVPHPTFDRTWFRLVVGGRHHSVLDVFRAAESKVIGAEAELVRSEAKRRDDPNLHLFSVEQAAVGHDHRYAEQHAADLARVVPMAQQFLRPGPIVWRKLRPRLLEELHLTPREVSEYCAAACRRGELSATPPVTGPRRTLRDEQMISLGAGGASALDAPRGS